MMWRAQELEKEVANYRDRKWREPLGCISMVDI